MSFRVLETFFKVELAGIKWPVISNLPNAEDLLFKKVWDWQTISLPGLQLGKDCVVVNKNVTTL
jgi:hypothetical protein